MRAGSDEDGGRDLQTGACYEVCHGCHTKTITATMTTIQKSTA
jgi:hypothetical protein